MSERMTIMKVREAYGNYGPKLLEEVGVLRSDPERKRGAPRRYLVEKPLPSKDEFQAMLTARYSRSLSSLIDEARSDIEMLRDELQEWYDNLPEAFQSGDKGSQLEDAIGNLDNISVDDLATELGKMSVVYLPMLECDSRRDRADESASKFRAVAEALREFANELVDQQNEEDDEAEEEEGEEVEDAKKLEGDPVEISEIADELDNAADELDSVEFPGMY